MFLGVCELCEMKFMTNFAELMSNMTFDKANIGIHSNNRHRKLLYN